MPQVLQASVKNTWMPSLLMLALDRGDAGQRRRLFRVLDILTA